MPLVNGPLHWGAIKTVVFDVDGTLYDQRRLRAHMLLAIVREAMRTGDLGFALTLRTYRKCREELSARDATDFVTKQFDITAMRSGRSPDEVRRIVSDWIDVRPLDYLAACVLPGVADLFRALKAAGKTIGVFSDYPARDKLAAMRLAADIIVCAADPGVARLKPNPQGLKHILAETATDPARCLMIGDRFERDAAAAAQCGVRALIRSSHGHDRYDTFRSYADDLFRPFQQ
jgi:FMN phosphatase YigB (HAD superfamily)